MKEKLMAQIQRYNPVNEQEETHKETLMDLLNRAEDISVRENLTGHLTASAWGGQPRSEAGSDGLSQAVRFLGMAGRTRRRRLGSV